MCELFALNSNAPASAAFSFSGLAERGGRTGEHKDGWGMAFNDASGCRVFVDAGQACDAPLAEFLRRHPIPACTVLAHVRKATQGAVALANCHPFQRECFGRHWVFAHNGDLKDFRPRLDGSYLPVGGTDSELAFCWLLQQVRRAFPGGATPRWPRLAPVLARRLPALARHGVFNMLLSDGHALYAYGATRLVWLERQRPFGRARLLDGGLEIDFSATNHDTDRMALVATRPLTDNEPWKAFEPGDLRVFFEGRSVWRQATSDADDRRDEPALAAELQSAG